MWAVGRRALGAVRCLSSAGVGERVKLVIFDTTLRDGGQSPGVSLDVESKLQIAKQLARLGVDVCEAGYPSASDSDFEAVRRIAREACKMQRRNHDDELAPWVLIGVTVEPHIKRCFEAVKEAPAHRIHTFISTSDIHFQYKLRISREEAVERAVRAVQYAKSLCGDVEFSPDDAGRSDPEFLRTILTEVIRAGASTVNIPDTVGNQTPEKFGELLSFLIKNTPGSERAVWSVHCHNDLGLAAANTLAGIKAGARQVEVTINGIGERAGNTPLEEIAMVCHVHRDSLPAYCDVDTMQIGRASQLVSRLTGVAVQPNKPVVGTHSFTREFGVWQSEGMHDVFQVISPDTVGVPESHLTLGKHSCKDSFVRRSKELGYDELTEGELDEAYRRFQRVADGKSAMSEMDLHAILNDQLSEPEEIFRLNRLHVTTGSSLTSTATISITDTRTGEELTDAAIGNGPIDAVIRTINRLSRIENLLFTYEVNSVSQGSEAVGDVRVRIMDPRVKPGGFYQGVGTDFNTVLATAKAYVSAVNRMVGRRRSEKEDTNEP